ncbi:MAG: HNH endonuclease [Clostridiales bacterium]|nr:HNH endonuclease [Clostridiales bacterium]
MNYDLMFNLSLAAIISIVVVVILYSILKNPYKFPYYTVDFDVSGRRNVVMLDEIENYLNVHGLDEFDLRKDETEEWKVKYSQKAHKSILRPLRVWQYNRTIDDEALFEFNLCRKQIRYRQRNYIKMPYEVMNTVETFDCDYDYIVGRYRELEKIGFETTTSRYRVKNQRRLMTQEMRERIKIRDNYTCQMCGKYMPDEVGLQIDHIVPVSKGGKTLESNLQVLCSVCNGRKSNKL